MPAKKITPKPGLFPDGTAVAAYPKRTVDVEVRQNLVPFPAPTASGAIANGAVTLEAAAGSYVLVGFVDEVQSIKVEATGGKFEVEFGEEETGELAYNISAEDLETALVGLESIGEGNVEVSGGPGDEEGTKPYEVKFIGDLAGTNVATLVVEDAALEGGEEQATVSTSTQGSKAGSGGVQKTCAFTIDAE